MIEVILVHRNSSICLQQIHLISIKYRFDEQLFVGTIERSIDHDDHWRTLYIRMYNNIIVAHIPGYYAMTGIPCRTLLTTDGCSRY